MCGRVRVDRYTKLSEWLESNHFPLYGEDELFLSPNIPPYHRPLLTGFINSDGEYDACPMNWGWIREWTKEVDGEIKVVVNKRLFNARRKNDKGHIWTNRLWGKAFRERRCLIPVNAFYEWDENQPKGKRDKYVIEYKEPVMGLGGIYEISNGELFMSICTTDPNKKMAKIHHRMPVIIQSKDVEEWLSSKDREAVDHLMQSAPDSWIHVDQV